MNDNQPVSDRPAPQDRTELFVSLLGRGAAQVHAHILTLLPNWADADEVLQRTNIILWRKFDDWQPDQDFTRWACGVARYEVKNFLRTQSRDRLLFDDSLLDALGDAHVAVAQELSEQGGQQEALRQCLQSLRPKDRQIIDGCYGDQHISAREVAERLGRPVNTVYKALIRIRRQLFECIQRKLSPEGRG